MSCQTEILKGYVVPNPVSARSNVAVNVDDSYRIITVYNESDQDVNIDYRTEQGSAASFIVPKNGRSFTRVINGVLLNNSLYITALETDASGNVIFNLGN